MAPKNIKIGGTPKKGCDPFSLDSGVCMPPASPIVISSSNVPRGNLAMPADAVVLFNGVSYSAGAVQDMAVKLRLARAGGDFPAMRGEYRDVRDIIDDYNTFSCLRAIRGDTPCAEWPSISGHDETLVNAAREISEREELYRERDSSANVFNRVSTMMQGVEMEDRLRQIMIQACQHAANNGNVQANSPTLAGVDVATVLNDIRSSLQRQSATGAHGVNELNMDAVFKEVFSILERGILDATGPMRLNNHILHQHNETLGRNNDTFHQTTAVMQENNEAMRQQVNAIQTLVHGVNAHVNGLGGHISAMGINLGAVSNNVNSTGTQVQNLQTLVNELPQMINNAVDQSIQNLLPPLFSAFLSPVIRDSQGRTIKDYTKPQRKSHSALSRFRRFFD